MNQLITVMRVDFGRTNKKVFLTIRNDSRIVSVSGHYQSAGLWLSRPSTPKQVLMTKRAFMVVEPGTDIDPINFLGFVVGPNALHLPVFEVHL